jgi:hypothetical protein
MISTSVQHVESAYFGGRGHDYFGGRRGYFGGRRGADYFGGRRGYFGGR